MSVVWPFRAQPLLLLVLTFSCVVLGTYYLRSCPCHKDPQGSPTEHINVRQEAQDHEEQNKKASQSEPGKTNKTSQQEGNKQEMAGGEPEVDVSKDGMTEIIVHSVRHIKRSNCTHVKYSKLPLPKTALASFPGSGNTWARHIIQLASGEKRFIFALYGQHAGYAGPTVFFFQVYRPIDPSQTFK